MAMGDVRTLQSHSGQFDQLAPRQHQCQVVHSQRRCMRKASNDWVQQELFAAARSIAAAALSALQRTWSLAETRVLALSQCSLDPGGCICAQIRLLCKGSAFRRFGAKSAYTVA